jgi:8-oxo-dGTP pyrophosphatase MutT (NUDIX family)
MYKVFFRDRTAYLGDDFSAITKKQYGLSYRYRNRTELQEVVDAYFRMEHIGSLYLVHEEVDQLMMAFSSCFMCIKAGGGVVRNPGDEFLMIERRWVWDLPKGKLKKGEDFEAGALREVEEETGLKGLELVRPIIPTFHTYELSGRLVLKETRWFEMLSTGGDEPLPQSEEGITRCRWVKPGKTGFIKKNTYMSILEVLRAGGML